MSEKPSNSVSENQKEEGSSTGQNGQPSSSSEEKEMLNIRVINQEGNEIHFKIRPTTQFKKLFNAYCDRMAVSSDAIRFLFNGQRIQPDDTAGSVCID